MPKLQINLPDGTKLDHELTDDLITIGRVADNTLQIDDASVSSHHAQLVLADGGAYELQDLGSTNGTRLNGKQIVEGEAHRMREGDKLRFGNIEASFGEPVAGTAEEMPDADAHVQKPAARSVKPSNFLNASPFQKKSKKKDPAAMAVWALAGVALLAVLAVAAMAAGLSLS